jgi:hypothetical protein
MNPRYALTGSILLLATSAAAQLPKLASLEGKFAYNGEDAKRTCEIYATGVRLRSAHNPGPGTSLQSAALETLGTALIPSPAHQAKATKAAIEEAMKPNHAALGLEYASYAENPASDPDQQKVELTKGSKIRLGKASEALREWIDLNCQNRDASEDNAPSDGRIADAVYTNGPVAPTAKRVIRCQIYPAKVVIIEKTAGNVIPHDPRKPVYTSRIKGPKEFQKAYASASRTWLRLTGAALGGATAVETAYNVNELGIRTALLVRGPGWKRPGEASDALGEFIRENCKVED